jgi:hypothetical protein
MLFHKEHHYIQVSHWKSVGTPAVEHVYNYKTCGCLF